MAENLMLEGMQVGAGLVGRAQEMAARRQQMQQAQELFPLHRAQLEQQLEIQSEKIRTDFLNKEHAALGLKSRNTVSEIMASDVSPDLKEQGLYSVVQSNPFVVNDPLWQESMKSLDASKKLLQQKAIADEVTTRTIEARKIGAEATVAAANVRANAPTKEERILEAAKVHREMGDEEGAKKLEATLEKGKGVGSTMIERVIGGLNTSEEEKQSILHAWALKQAGMTPQKGMSASAKATLAKAMPELMLAMKSMEKTGGPEYEFLKSLLEDLKSEAKGSSAPAKESGLPVLKFDPTSMTIPK